MRVLRGMRRSLALTFFLTACASVAHPLSAPPLDRKPPVALAAEPPPDPSAATTPSAVPSSSASVAAAPELAPPSSPGLPLEALPAISDDGKTIVIANEQSLGARGDSRMLLDFVDVASDRLLRRIVVSDPDHPEATPGGTEKALRVLAEQHWIPLVALTVEEDPGAPERQGGLGAAFRNNRATGEGLSIEYREPVLVVRETASGRTILRKREGRWSLPGGRACPDCVDCPPPLANDAGVWTNAGGRVLVVGLDFLGGTDLCWEPPRAYHVVVRPDG
jgi:hypothetical protein